MAMHAIEPGQRLQTVVGGQIRFVQVLVEAVVPAGYWLCREEASGQSRVIAQTALVPVAMEPVAGEPVAAEGVAVQPVAIGPVEQIAPLPTAPLVETAITAAA